MESDHGWDYAGRNDILPGSIMGSDNTTAKGGSTYCLKVEREQHGVRSLTRLRREEQHTF
jgi:hypothetical protein